MANRQYPVNIGGGLPKQGIGIRSRNRNGYDVYIMDRDMSHQYIQLHFCTLDGLVQLIRFLGDIRKLWVKETADGERGKEKHDSHDGE